MCRHNTSAGESLGKSSSVFEARRAELVKNFVQPRLLVSVLLVVFVVWRVVVSALARRKLADGGPFEDLV